IITGNGSPNCIISFHIGFSQQPVASDPLVLSNITEENGLSDNHVQCVLKDKEGFVWIGTSDGLNLMDGSAIKIFKHINNDSNSLIDNNILSLTEDKDGNIWIGTYNGLSCYHRNKHNFLSFQTPLSPYGASGAINTIVIDHQSRIWCSGDGGLMLFDKEKRKFTFYYNNITELQSSPTYSNKLRYMMLDNDNDLWLCSNDGLWTFSLQTMQFKKEIHQSNDPQYHPLFMYVFQGHDEKIWAGNWQYGLKQLDRNTGTVINYTTIADRPDNVHCINEIKQPDGKYILWLNGNLLAFDPVEKKFFHYPKPLKMIESPDVSPVFQSTDGWIWLAGDKGLYIYSPQRQNFQHHLFPAPLTSQGIVFTEWNHLLLAGAQETSFLLAYDTSWALKKNLTPSFGPSFTNTQSAAALTFAKKDDHNLWIGNTSGVVSIDLLTNKTKWFTHKDNDSTSLPRNFITRLFFDSHKTLWVFPWREGIWQMNTQTGACKKLWDGFIHEPDHIKRLLIADAAEDNNGNIWMADLDEGIILYDRKSNTFSKPFVKEIGEQYNASRIFFKNGFLYANTTTAILKWDADNRKLQIFALPPEMNKVIYDMAPDKENNWWLTTRNGLVVFNEQLHSFKRYTTNDGLTNNDINATLFCRENGDMLIGAASYYTSFNPAKLNAISGTAAKVVLTDLLVNDRIVQWDSTTTLNLDHHSTNVLFRWAFPDYANPLKNQYYYQLERFDADWKYAGNKGEIQYANLSPGKYQILLKATTANGTSSANTITINFVIHPPYWRTTWFILACLAAFIIFLILVVRYISRRNLKEKLLRLEKEQAIEKERNRISRDMHDDLGSGLTKIAIMSEVVKKQLNEPEKAKQQLENISSSSRELVDSLQDIIWVLNPKNDTLESLASYVREYGLKFFEPSGTQIHFKYPEKFSPIKLSEETRRNIFLVIKESFNNIAKHAWCNNVTVTIAENSSSILVKIEDDGKGFDESQVRLFGNGLINMKNRISQIGGEYNLASEAGHGTQITMNIPL
ncbi:MAG: two-component regulator propeller domain-containing protein, partial [Chitinophagaceae bacterium]